MGLRYYNPTSDLGAPKLNSSRIDREARGGDNYINLFDNRQGQNW